MLYVTINTVSELLCFAVGLIFLYRDKDRAWKVLLAYLLLTGIVEITGIHIRKVWRVSNIPLYNGFILFECFVTSYFFNHLYQPFKLKRKWLAVWLSLFILMYMAELAAGNFTGFVSVTATIMSVFFVLASLYYYHLKLNDDHFESLLFSPQFWWVNGVLFFYFGGTACNLFFDYLIKNPSVSYTHSIRYIIFNILNVILYSFWSYAFICRYLQKKSYSLSD